VEPGMNLASGEVNTVKVPVPVPGTSSAVFAGKLTPDGDNTRFSALLQRSDSLHAIGVEAPCYVAKDTLLKRRRSYDEDAADANNARDNDIGVLNETCFNTECCKKHFCGQQLLKVKIDAVKLHAYVSAIKQKHPSRAQFKEYLRTEIINSRGLTNADTPNLPNASFRILGHTVCATFWHRVHGISKSLYHEICKEIARGKTFEPMRIPREITPDDSTVVMNDFIDDMAQLCEVMPHSDLQGDDATTLFDLSNGSLMADKETRYYPNMYTWTSMHAAYTTHANKCKQRNPSLEVRKSNAYRKAAQKRWPRCLLVDGEGKTAFTCKECAQLKAAYSSTHDAKKQLKLLYCMNMHAHRFKRARRYFQQTIAEALCHPERVLSIIMDGMDQNKCCCPRGCTRSELPANCTTKFHVIGALVHGIGMYPHVFLAEKWDQAKPQVTVTVLLSTLREVYNEKGFLPPVLKLQLDNPTGENKNHDVFSFVSLLVAWSVFDEVYVSFCVVGHTHLDIDQVFSRYSVAFRKGHWTLEDFLKFLRTGHRYNDRDGVVLYKDHVLDWHTACKDNVRKVDGISKPLLFRFKRNAEGKVEMSYKHHCEKKEWKGNLVVYDAPISCDDVSVSQWVPRALDVIEMKRRVTSFKPNIPAAERTRVLASWASLLQQEDEMRKAYCAECMQLRECAAQAAGDAYATKKQHDKKRGHGDDAALAQVRSLQKIAKDALLQHLSQCDHTRSLQHPDFEWLKTLQQSRAREMVRLGLGLGLG